MAAVDTQKSTPVALSASSTPFQFKADSPSFVPQTKSTFDPNNLPSASNGAKKLTFYSPSQFYPTQQPYYYGGAYGPDGVFYGGYDASSNAGAGAEDLETIADVVVVKNLPFSLTDDMLLKETVKVVAASCVASVTRVTDRKGRFKGTAFVKFVSVDAADDAMVQMSEMVIMGRPVKLERMRAKGQKKKKKKKKKKKGLDSPPVFIRCPPKSSTPETTHLVPAEEYEGKVRKVHRKKIRSSSDIDMNWRSKTSATVDLPEDPASRAACQKLVQFKKSAAGKSTMLTVNTADQLKQLIRVSHLLNLNHQIEEVTGTSWTVKFTRKSFFEAPRGGGKGDRRYRSWSGENFQPGTRSARGVRKSDNAESGFRQRYRARTFSRERTYSMKDRSASFGRDRKERSESLVLFARGPDGTRGFKAAGRGCRK